MHLLARMHGDKVSPDYSPSLGWLLSLPVCCIIYDNVYCLMTEVIVMGCVMMSKEAAQQLTHSTTLITIPVF